MDATTGNRANGWRRWLWVAGAGLVGVAVFVLYWFQPQKLFIDDRVDEAIPAGAAPAAASSKAAASGSAAPSASAPSGPAELARGTFASLEHETVGAVRVLKLADGSRIVRLEGFDTSNGPDLYLYLSTNPANGAEQAFDDDYLSLGHLKGNSGDQNYTLPADSDLGRFESVVIWCDRFNAAFGAADLAAA
jgi:hypothetical protein